MRKRIISIVLAVAMILCLIPIGVLAADDTTSTVNPATGRVQGPEGDVDVAVMVYGDVITNYLNNHSDSTIDQLVAAVSDYAKNLAGGVDAPKVEMYLVNPKTNEEYKLTEQSVKEAAFLSSFTYEAEGIFGFSETIYNWISNLIGWWFEDDDELESLYRIYTAPKVPEGDYQLEIRNVEVRRYDFTRLYPHFL